ncbi:hypothetical protein JCM8202_000941 [Rhodotorula sphaerocarpa]
MASLKAMMASKKAAQRISAPHAKYSASGQLSCALCGLALKHESLWGAHVQSKAHRVNVQRYQAEQAAAEERAAAKRKRDSNDDAGSDDDGAKRARQGPAAGAGGGDEQAGGALPAGFFADPSQAPSPSARPDEAVEGEGATAAGSAAAAEPAEEDPEWAEFERYLASGEGPAEATPTQSTASATIQAAPVKFEFGAPVVAEEGGDGQENGAEGDEDEEPEETEEERIAREMREEREEMMARLEEEEREQREADEKVTVLKRRLEAIRAARQKKAAS